MAFTWKWTAESKKGESLQHAFKHIPLIEMGASLPASGLKRASISGLCEPLYHQYLINKFAKEYTSLHSKAILDCSLELKICLK